MAIRVSKKESPIRTAPAFLLDICPLSPNSHTPCLWGLADEFPPKNLLVLSREFSGMIPSNNHPSNPQQPIHSRQGTVRWCGQRPIPWAGTARRGHWELPRRSSNLRNGSPTNAGAKMFRKRAISTGDPPLPQKPPNCNQVKSGTSTHWLANLPICRHLEVLLLVTPVNIPCNNEPRNAISSTNLMKFNETNLCILGYQLCIVNKSKKTTKSGASSTNWAIPSWGIIFWPPISPSCKWR